MRTYRAPRSGIVAYREGKDYIVVQFKTGERYRYDHRKPGEQHVAEMKSRARRTSGLTTYINQHVRDNYAAKLPQRRANAPKSPPTSRRLARRSKRR